MHSNFNISIGYCLFIQILNILIDLSISTQFSAFWLIPDFVFKFQILHWFPPFTQISAFWSIWIPFSLRFQHFDRSDILHSNFNILINFQRCPILINSLISIQIPIFWSISTFAVKYQHLINLWLFTQISTFWRIWHLVFKFEQFDQSPLYTQISTFWLIPNFSLEFQHF